MRIQLEWISPKLKYKGSLVFRMKRNRKSFFKKSFTQKGIHGRLDVDVSSLLEIQPKAQTATEALQNIFSACLRTCEESIRNRMQAGLTHQVSGMVIPLPPIFLPLWLSLQKVDKVRIVRKKGKTCYSFEDTRPRMYSPDWTNRYYESPSKESLFTQLTSFSLELNHSTQLVSVSFNYIAYKKIVVGDESGWIDCY